ncbi:MAG: hypothetical protein ISS71_01145 [Phycisphaerae bacterium]|nr:hypothetical protein [Phycisphaerae bacterium]
MSIIYLLSWMGLIFSVNDAPAPNQTPDFYGNAIVSKILRIDETCTLYCDIQDFPRIIGENMPVKISGLKTADTIEYNQKIQKFLSELLLTETEAPKKIALKNIRRGKVFCFVADIEIDGEDLCDLLVANGLAQRVIEVKEPAASSSTASPASQIGGKRTQKTEYVASKTSKIFHRVGCSHAKRINADKAVYFSSRQEAIRTGRQPCKTCNP